VAFSSYIRPAEGPAPKPTIRGGYVCIPPKHLVNPSLANYEPLPAHDFLSFLILVNVLLFPSTWNELRTSNIFDPSKDENHRLRNFWIAVEKSNFWNGKRTTRPRWSAMSRPCDSYWIFVYGVEWLTRRVYLNGQIILHFFLFLRWQARDYPSKFPGSAWRSFCLL